MQTAIKQFDSWHKTKAGHIVMGLLELGAAYVLGSLAIDSGSLWEYLFGIIFFVGAVQNFVQLILAFRKHHGNV